MATPRLSGLLALFPAVAAAGPMDRLRGVSEHARSRVEDGPEHLGVLVAAAVVAVVVIAAAAWWTSRRKKR